jgi:DNA-binding NarL/FixJ family response regulator
MRILILEDNVLMQQSLADLLVSEGHEIVAAQDNARNIIKLYEHGRPDILIMDIDMPDVNGLEGLKTLKAKYPEARVLMFTVFEDNDKVLNAICLGANGYILKSSSEQKISEAIQDVVNGGSPLTPAIASKILRHFPKKTFSASMEEDIALSGKEKEVLELLVKGYSYKMIASELNKSTETIRTQIKNIYRKLNVASNAEAIIKTLNSKIT